MQEHRIAIFARCGMDGTAAMHSYIGALTVPKGYETEFIELPQGENVAAAYQHAMEASDARYKIYLDEGNIILKEDLLVTLLHIFGTDETIGLIGLVGTEQLAANGIFAQSPHVVGKLLYPNGQRFDGDEQENDLADVMTVTGNLIATQYDVPWRSDLFPIDSFWAESQCAEFRRRGYRCVVPQQEKEWLFTGDKRAPIHEASRQAFLDTYSAELFPLVSIIIPTYERLHFFRLALESVLAQTYRNLDIFVTDNSHNTETADMMARDFADDSRIHYEHHPEFDAAGNWARAMAYDHPNAVYVNWLMDDDLFLPQKIEKMVGCFFANPDLSIVTSYRLAIDAEGNPLPDTPLNASPFTHTTKLSGASAGRTMLMEQVNFIGEPTTALVRKDFLLDGHRLGWTGREGKYLISDFPTWLRLLAAGNLLYLVEPLSCFRHHAGQDQLSSERMIAGRICWALSIAHAIETGAFLEDDGARRTAILQWIHGCTVDVGSYKDKEDVWGSESCRDLIGVLQDMAAALSGGHSPAFSFVARLGGGMA